MEITDIVQKLSALEVATAESLPSKGAGRQPYEVIRAALAAARSAGPDVEVDWRLPDPAHQRVFVALCTRYSIAVYLRPKKPTFTVVVRAPRAFVDGVLEPLFEEMSLVIDEWNVERTEAAMREFMAPLPDEPLPV